MADVLQADDVGFDAHATAAEWEAHDALPVGVAARIVNEFTDHTALISDGYESDRDVVFPGPDLLVEEKAVGVCRRETAEKFAPAYVELDREDDRVLAVNPAQVMPGHTPPTDDTDGEDFDADTYQKEHTDEIVDLLESRIGPGRNRYDAIRPEYVPHQGVECFKIPFSGKYVFDRTLRELEDLGFEVTSTVVRVPDDIEPDDVVEWKVTQEYAVRATEPVLED